MTLPDTNVLRRVIEYAEATHEDLAAHAVEMRLVLSAQRVFSQEELSNYVAAVERDAAQARADIDAVKAAWGLA